jgi:hypothetical protein
MNGAVVERSDYALGGMMETCACAEVELGKPYFGAQAVEAPSCRQWYPLFQAERH